MPNFLVASLIGLQCFTVLTVVFVWWHLTLLTNKLFDASERRFADQIARTQVLMAQNAEILRKLEQ